MKRLCSLTERVFMREVYLGFVLIFSFGALQAKTKREREKEQAKTKYIGTEETDVNSNMEFPSHSQVSKKVTIKQETMSVLQCVSQNF